MKENRRRRNVNVAAEYEDVGAHGANFSCEHCFFTLSLAICARLVS